MTREDIINEIRCLLSELDNGEDAVSYLTQNDVKWLKENIKALEQESTLEKDGTLIVTTEHYENVGRVLVQYGTNGTLFYQDQQIDGALPILERYKLRMPPTVYDELVADIMNMDEQ